ncbi:MAG: MOSC domain-containing protein [Planctomycetota bacterium]
MNLQEGRLLGIAFRECVNGSMVEVDTTSVTMSAGLADDSRGKPGARQVTVLASEDWQSACDVLRKDLHWTLRRANLLVEGLKLEGTTDSLIRIGELTLQVTGETDPCGRMDQAEPGLRAALTPGWRGGVCCRVITDGVIASGSKVTLQSPDP